jgi:hypothetical protein
LPAGTVLAVTMHDPKTGRFAVGNTAARLRALKAGARHLIGLDPAKCAPWARGFVAVANADARRLVEEHGVQDDTALVRQAENVALANAVARGLAVLGLQGEGDRAALAEAKAWMQEHRQGLLTLKAEAREHARQREQAPMVSGDPVVAARMASVQERRRRIEASTYDEPSGEATTIEATLVRAESEDAPQGDVVPAMDNDEPPRRARVDDAPADDRPVRVSDRVVARVEGERQERAAHAVARVLVEAGVIGGPGSGDPLAPPAPATPGLCLHGVNPRACPSCAMAAQQAQLTENRERIERDRR